MALTQSELAKALGIDPAMVTRDKARGMPVDSVEAARAWRDQNVRARVDHKGKDKGREGDGGAAVADPDYWTARSQREAHEAAIAGLKRAELEGALIRVDAMRIALATTISSTRDALLQIPARLAPVLAAETDAAQVHNLLQAELHQALARLTSAPDRLPAGQGLEPNQPPALTQQAQAAIEGAA